jgi:hypothetical protein
LPTKSAAPPTDHGYPVDPSRRCSAMTKKERQCQLPPIADITLCALHAGLAHTRWSPDYGSARALASFKLASPQHATNRTLSGRR